jgi:type I restriction enzyme, S subunit
VNDTFQDLPLFQAAKGHMLPLLADAFEGVSDAPNGIAKLRELILDLAVRGKLVPQDPNDEPASELLKRIAAEKARLIKEKKIRKPKALPPIGTSPFALPLGWEWIQMGALATDIHYGYTASARPDLTGVRLLRITDIQDDRVDWETVPGCEINERKYETSGLHEGDLLIARTGGTIGKTYLVQGLSVKAVFASYLIRVIPTPPADPVYLKRFAQSPI